MKLRRKLFLIFLTVLFIQSSTIDVFANDTRYTYLYITRDTAWPEKGINYKDIIEICELGNYGWYTVGEVVMTPYGLLQITQIDFDNKGRLSSFYGVNKNGTSYYVSNHSNYSLANGKVKRITPNFTNSSMNVPSGVTAPYPNSYFQNIESQGWQKVHDFGVVSNYDEGTWGNNQKLITYVSQYSHHRQYVSDPYAIFGPGILNMNRATNMGDGSYSANYGAYGSYNPRLYEHKVILFSDKSNYRLYIGDARIVDGRGANPSNSASLTGANEVAINSSEIDIPVGKSFSVHTIYTGATTESQYYARVYRRYKGQVANVQGVSVTQTGSDSFRATANVTHAGLPEAEEHGHVWSTNTANLTYELAPNKTKLGWRDTTGQYSSNITGCLPGVTYYTRAYIINELGITYGAIQSFKINTPPSVTITEPTADQFINKGNNINIKANVSDGEGDNITYNIKIGTSQGASNLYNGTPNGTITNTLVTHAYNTSALPLTWNGGTNRYEQKVFIRITANDGKVGGETIKDITSIVGNYKPGITLTAGKTTSNYGETLELTGKSWDSFGGKLTISTSIGGKSISTTLNTSPATQPAADNYTLRWQGTNVPAEGEYSNIVITVSDEHGGSNSVTLSKITITDILNMIKSRIQEHILLDSGSDLRFLIIDTDTKITETQRNNQLLEQIRTMIKNRETHLFFIGNDNDTKNYIQRYLKDLN